MHERRARAVFTAGGLAALVMVVVVSALGGIASALADGDITMAVRVLDADRQAVPDTAYTKDVTLYFPFLGGTFFGEAQDAMGIRKRVRVGDRLRFDLAALGGRVEAVARRWRDDPGAVTVSPPDARLVRFGTASAREDGSPFADLTFTLDLESKETVFLVYTDRPCSIRGEGRMGATKADYAVDLPRRGFHWVRVQLAGADRVRLRADATMTEATLGLQIIGRRGEERGGLTP